MHEVAAETVTDWECKKGDGENVGDWTEGDVWHVE